MSRSFHSICSHAPLVRYSMFFLTTPFARSLLPVFFCSLEEAGVRGRLERYAGAD
ncbi:MAG: hypothetical protein AAGU27_10980 [Dehalobacterium sp.]